MLSTERRRTGRRALASALLASLLPLIALVASPARGDDPVPPVPIAAGTGLDWGIKQSFRTYIEGPIAAGSITVSDGASRNGDGTFHFPVIGGSFDATTNATIVQFGGTVHMEGHDGALEMSVADPRVELTPTETRLVADLSSLPLGGGPVVRQDDVVFASLGLDGLDPVVDAGAGTTTWSAIPSLLSAAAVSAFASHYSVGTPLDPLTFGYDGPGGKPIPPLESWSAPGAPVFSTVASTSLTSVAVGALEPDPANGVVHVVGRMTTGGSPTTYRALDATTLAETAALTEPTQTWTGNGQLTITRRTAFAGGTLYAASVAGPVRRTRLDAGAYVQDDPIGGAASAAPTHLAAAPDASRLYLAGGTPPARLLTRSGTDWTEQSRTLDASEGITSDLAVDADGTVLETHRAGTPHTRPIAVLDYDVDPLGRTDVADTLPSTGNGLVLLATGPGGVAYGAEQDAALSRVQKLAKGPSGYAAAGGLLDLGVKAREIAVDASDGTLWIGAQGTAGRHPLLAVRDGAIVGEVTLPGSADQVAAANGTAYVANLNGNVWAVRQLGVTPAVSDQPADVAIALAADESAREVTFDAAATGTPAPSVRWQARPPGAATFTDLPGETTATLTLDASVADDGTQYRAVFANDTGGATPQAVGELATDAATLTVRAAPSLAVQPADVAALEGSPALLKALPSGNPAPAVQWQRLDGGVWSDVPGGSDAFLSIPATTREMDGAQFRVVLTNDVGTTTSQAARLTVTPRLPPSVTFGSGHLDWGVKESFRRYIEGPVAHGSYAASDGAVRNGDGTIRFELLGGTYESATRSGELQLRGTVRFTGHDAPGGPQLDLTLRDPRLVLAGDVGTLHAHATSKALGSGELQQFPDVALASIDLTGVAPAPLLGGLGFDALPAALTPAGVPVFAQYAAGVAMDALSLVALYGVPRPLPRTGPPGGQPPDPPADVLPPPAAERPRGQAVSARAGTAPLGTTGRTTTVAVVTCRRGPCRLTLPRRALARIGRRTFRAEVLAPRSLASGRRAAVRVRLTRRAAARLGCRRARVRLRIAVAGAEGRTSRLVTVAVQRTGARCRR